ARPRQALRWGPAAAWPPPRNRRPGVGPRTPRPPAVPAPAARAARCPSRARGRTRSGARRARRM
ncbi:hypothetical protein E4099_32665, partial [Streptomyces palmae]